MPVARQTGRPRDQTGGELSLQPFLTRISSRIASSERSSRSMARARAAGVDPGGDIFIHGQGPRFQRVRGDWTDGCIAVRDREIEEVYAMVRNGTPVTITA